jgi:recombination protein RecA
MAQKLALSRAVDLLIVDPAAALVPALELETGIGASGPGLQSRVLAAGLRNLAGTLKRTQATAMFLNQTRSRAGDEELSAGGPALKLHAAVRIALEAAGKAGRTRFRVLKNKVGERFLQGELLWISPRELGEVP